MLVIESRRRKDAEDNDLWLLLCIAQKNVDTENESKKRPTFNERDVKNEPQGFKPATAAQWASTPLLRYLSHTGTSERRLRSVKMLICLMRTVGD